MKWSRSCIPDEYPMNEGRIASNRGLSIAAADFDAYFAESQVPHSTAMHCLKRDTQSTYLVGPLARVNLNFDRLAEPRGGWPTSCRSSGRVRIPIAAFCAGARGGARVRRGASRFFATTRRRACRA